MRCSALIFVSIFGCLIRTGHAHVSLTFPPARFPSLDFLDNARTKGPCGVPKPPLGKGTATTLRSGSTFNVTWTLTYPHQGGFRIELLDDKDQPRYALTPETVQFIGQEDQTAQTYQVTLPSDFECQNCGIRLLRQAGEWGEYQFWSCADINILREPKDTCQGHGEAKEDGQCRCDRLYSGEACQSKDECWVDQDCGVNGKCQELKMFAYPRRVCYCKQGWFGPGCNSPSTLQKDKIDTAQYQSQEFGVDKNKMFWRILKDENEIEIVLQYPSTSWIGIGWRPENVAGTCGNIDRLIGVAPGASQASSAVPNPSAEPRPTSTDGGLPTLPNLPPYTINGTDGSAIDQRPTIVHTVGGETTVENPTPVAAQPGASSNSTESEEPDDEGPLVTGIPGVGTGPEFTGAPVPFPPPYASANGSQGAKADGSTESEVIGDLCYGDWRYPSDCTEACDLRTSWTYIEESDEIEFSIEAKSPPNSWTALGFSPTGKMSDADMIVVKSLQNRLTILDMFTNGYAPPAKDPLQNVTVGPVAGTHVNGVLRTSFRRPRRSSDPHDVSFTDTDCYYFLLASGTLNTDGSMNKHTAKPHVSKRKICIASCSPSPLGSGGEKFVTCDREFKYPPGCKPPACEYMANWTYIAQAQEVQFQISAKEIGRWTGIGFSREGNMTNSDIIMGWVYENGTFLTDRYAYGRHQPAIDKQQDVRDVHGIIEDDIQTITFSRKMVTNDPEDISLKECLYYLFPVGGGRVLARTSKDFQDKTTALGFHDQTLPKISRDLICICNDDGIPVNITSNARMRRQAQAPPPIATEAEAEEEEEEAEQVQTQPPAPRRPPSLPQGQTAVNITLGARPIPIVDPQALPVTQLPTTTQFISAEVDTSIEASGPIETPPPIGSGPSRPKPVTTVEPEGEEEEEEEEEPATTESLLRLQSAIVGNGSRSVTVKAQPVPVATVTRRPAAALPTTTTAEEEEEASESEEPTSEEATITPAVSKVPVAKPEPTANGTAPQPEPAPGSSVSPPQAEPNPHAHPVPEPEPKPEGEPTAAGPGDLHPMDCVDMVIGSAVGQYSRVGDFYSITRATPKPDEYYGGTSSLTAVTGFEENGVTTIAFRRRLTSADPFDHNITNSMFFVWAKGQEIGAYSHATPSGLDHGSVAVKEFYQPDVLAYHGNKNRGSFTLNFGDRQGGTTPAGPNSSSPSKAVAGCRQDFLYPSGCKGQSCHYNVTWLKYGGDVEFSIEADLANNHWTGIAFSKDGFMAKSDAVIIMAESVGPPEVTDRFMTGYDVPTEDKKQNIFNIEASYVNGRVSARFTRPLLTDDAEEDLDLNDCVYFLYPYNGGPIAEHRVQKHSVTPLRSAEQICLNKCQINTVADESKTPGFSKKPPELATAVPVVDHGRRFLVVVRIINEQWNEALAMAGTPQHDALSMKVVKMMDNLLRSKFAGFEKAHVLKFTQGSVIADVEVAAAGVNSVQLHEAIMPQGNAAALYEGLQIDPEHVRVKEIQTGLSQEEVRNYIIIAVACFLVMVATAFAVCMIVRTRRRRTKEMKSNWNLVPFTPYAYLMPPSGGYPIAYQYPAMGPMGAVEPKKVGGAPYHHHHDSAVPPGYSADYSATGSRQLGSLHHRQYSNATTATPVTGKTPSPVNDKHNGRTASVASSHKTGQQGPNGETTYAEWFHRVNGAQGGQQQQQQQQQSQQPPAGSRQSTASASAATPYVQYPNDPYSFYTMGGSNRSVPFQQAMPTRQPPPPGYYRPY